MYRKEPLKMCDYCCKTGRARNITRVQFGKGPHSHFYCPKCLPVVLENVKSLPWEKDVGYTIWEKGSHIEKRDSL